MRLFVALKLPKKQRTRIHRAIRGLREEELPVRWTDPANYHVTLKFLGEVRRERMEGVGVALEQVAGSTKAFTVEFDGFGAFPTVRRPRVIWLGIESTPEFRCMKQDLEWAMGEAGFEAETRAFHPHVTVGRAGPSGGAGAFRGLDRRLAELGLAGEIRVHTLDLMRSHLSRGGASYSVVHSARLASS